MVKHVCIAISSVEVAHISVTLNSGRSSKLSTSPRRYSHAPTPPHTKPSLVVLSCLLASQFLATSYPILLPRFMSTPVPRHDPQVIILSLPSIALPLRHLPENNKIGLYSSCSCDIMICCSHPPLTKPTTRVAILAGPLPRSGDPLGNWYWYSTFRSRD